MTVTMADLTPGVWEALEREALAAAAARWRAGAEPCCAYEAALFAEWDTGRSAP